VRVDSSAASAEIFAAATKAALSPI